MASLIVRQPYQPIVKGKNGMDSTALQVRLEQLRGGISYREFAELCGMSESGMRKYFPPFNSVPSLDKAAAIAAARGVSPAVK